MMAKHTAWEKVQISRHPKRPTSITLIKEIFPDFIELKGDRQFRDDPAIIGGIATLNQQPITIIAEEKGTTTEERIKRNFGMPHPEGYHKSYRLAKQAEKFNRPILFIIDTPGAYPGIGAEERGQANAISKMLSELMTLKVPIISVVLGEGGSGGALAIGIADRVYMFENAIYSILSPEGFASILYKDASLAKEASENMKITAEDLLNYQMIDGIVPESKEGLHEEYHSSFSYLKQQIQTDLASLLQKGIDDLLQDRYLKYRKMGLFQE